MNGKALFAFAASARPLKEFVNERSETHVSIVFQSAFTYQSIFFLSRSLPFLLPSLSFLPLDLEDDQKSKGHKIW